MKLNRIMWSAPLGAAVIAASLYARPARAEEFPIGGPVVRDGVEIVPNYLVGIQMDRMPPGMAMAGADVVHLECDAHATQDEAHGFAADAWMPDLTIRYVLTKQGSNFRATGRLFPMTAKDGPHYANNVAMGGPGIYQLDYTVEPPSSNGFLRHVDAKTGVPDWWKPIKASWTFTYPVKPAN